MTNRAPSIELSGKSEDGKNVIARFDADALPVNEQEWAEHLNSLGISASAEKSAGNVRVGNFYGYVGIQYNDTLERVLEAREINQWCQNRPEYLLDVILMLRAYATHMDVDILDVDPERLRITSVSSWREAVELVRPRAVVFEALNDLEGFLDWKGYFQSRYSKFYFQRNNGRIFIAL